VVRTPLISVIQECYQALEEMKAELMAQKKARGQPEKTTFSECVCMLIREHREAQNIPLIHENGLAQESSSSENTPPTSYPVTRKTGLSEDVESSPSPSSPPSLSGDRT